MRYTYLGWWRDAPIDFATWKDRFPHHIEIAENKVSDACRYRVALPLGKIFLFPTARTATTTAAMNHAFSQVISPIWGRRAFNCLKIDAPAAWNDGLCRWITFSKFAIRRL